MQKVTPMLWYDGKAEEAVGFYLSVFPKSKRTDVLPHVDPAPSPKNKPLTVSFEIDGQAFVALNGGPEFKFNESVSFVIDCADQKEVDYYWEKLTADGGQESMCGWLKDKYGVSWQVTPREMIEILHDKDRKRAERAMQALMTMRKIDIAKIRKAAQVR